MHRYRTSKHPPYQPDSFVCSKPFASPARPCVPFLGDPERPLVQGRDHCRPRNPSDRPIRVKQNLSRIVHRNTFRSETPVPSIAPRELLTASSMGFRLKGNHNSYVRSSTPAGSLVEQIVGRSNDSTTTNIAKSINQNKKNKWFAKNRRSSNDGTFGAPLWETASLVAVASRPISRRGTKLSCDVESNVSSDAKSTAGEGDAVEVSRLDDWQPKETDVAQMASSVTSKYRTSHHATDSLTVWDYAWEKRIDRNPRIIAEMQRWNEQPEEKNAAVMLLVESLGLDSW